MTIATATPAAGSTAAPLVLLSCQVWLEGEDVPPTVHFQRVGKRPGRRSLPAMSVGHAGSLLFITDTLSGRRFLCDTGAQVSVLPAATSDKQAAGWGPVLLATNGTPIRTFGKRCLSLRFGGQRFQWSFVTASVPMALLGADFLCAHGLLVDVKRKRLVQAETFSSHSMYQVTNCVYYKNL